MKLLKIFFICIILLMSALPGFSDEVDLNKVKKKETERRKKVKKKQKVFTNASVDKIVKSSKKSKYIQMPDSDALRRSNRQADIEEKPGSKSNAAGSEAVVDKKKTRSYWAERKGFLEQKIADLEKKIKEEQLKLNGLSSNLMNMDLPAQRTMLKDKVGKASYSLEKNKQLLVQYKSELEKLEDEARRSGIPAGWLR